MVLSQFICERHGDVERKKRERAHIGKGRRPNQVKNEGDYIDADVWDDGAVFGDADDNKALVADLMMFDGETSPTGGQHVHARHSSFMSSFTFNVEDGDFGDEFDYSSNAEDLSDESNSYSHDDDEHAHTGADEPDRTYSGFTSAY
jgi:hypothetical protein